MLSSKILTGRREREAGLEAQAEPSGSPASPSSPCPHARPKLWICDQQGDVQGATLLTSTALVRGMGITPRLTPLPPATSLGRETSRTDPALLEELLPWMARPASGPGMGAAGCALSLAKAALGAGLVAIPHAFALLGAVPATAALLATAALALLSCRCLAAGVRATGRDTFAGVVAAQLGAGVGVAADAAVALYCFGMLVVYLMAATDVLMPGPQQHGQGLPPWLSLALRCRPAVLGVLTVAVLAPLASFRRLKHPTAASLVGVAAVVMWVAATLCLAALLAVHGRAHPPRPWPAWELLRGSWAHSAVQLAAVLPVILTAFVCQTSFVSVSSELEAPASARHETHVAAAALGVSLALTWLLAAGSGAAFGAGVGHNVLARFSLAGISELLGPGRSHPAAALGLVLAARGAFLVCALASLPLLMQPLRRSLAGVFHPRSSHSPLQAAPELQARQFHLLTCAVLAAAYAAAVLARSSRKPLQLLGSTAGATLALLLPGCLGLSLARWRLRGAEGLGGVMLLLSGVVLAVAGLADLTLH